MANTGIFRGIMANSVNDLRDGEHDYSTPQLFRGRLVERCNTETLHLSYTPPSFLTAAQLLQLRFRLFLVFQTQFKSSLTLLSLSPSYAILKQFSAVVGFTSQPQLLPIVFSDTDPIAHSVVSTIIGSAPSFHQDAVLLDKLDLAEFLGDDFASTKPSPNDCTSQHTSRGEVQSRGVDIAVSSLLQDACKVAELAVLSVHSLFQCLGPIPSSHASAGPLLYCNRLQVPVPFQRVCLSLQQHLHWVPSTQLVSLPQKQTVKRENNHTTHSFVCGSHNTVEFVCVANFPLERLFEWYQVMSAEQLLPQIEPTSSVWRLLRNSLNFNFA
jgi:hypothetical protein